MTKLNFELICSDTPGVFEVADLGLTLGYVHKSAPLASTFIGEVFDEPLETEFATLEDAAQAVWEAYVASGEFA